MNIAFVNSTKKWGGVKTHTIEFAAALVKNGHQVFIYARQPSFLEAAKANQMIPMDTSFSFDFNPLSIARFRQEFRHNRIDLVIANVGKDMATAGVAAKLLGIPLVQHLGAGKDIAPKLKYKIIHKLLNPFFFCTADFIAQEFMQHLPWINKERVTVVLNGKKTTNHPLTTNSPRKFVANHQLVSGKDYKSLLKALALQSEPFLFEIVGVGPQEKTLRSLASKLNIQDKIIWHGFLPNPMEVLNKADIFLLASLSEGLPNTLLEALAAGLLPICRDVGGVREVWPDELEQWLLPYNATAQDFAKVIERALKLGDTELLELKAKSRETCKKKCAFELMAKEFERYLLSILENKKTFKP